MIQNQKEWISLRQKYPLAEQRWYNIRDCRHNIFGKAFYNGYDFIDQHWIRPLLGSMLHTIYEITHWSEID